MALFWPRTRVSGTTGDNGEASLVVASGGDNCGGGGGGKGEDADGAWIDASRACAVAGGRK